MDRRSFITLIILPLLALGANLIALGRPLPVAAQATFIVTSPNDAGDSNLGDGECKSTLIDNPCTLRAAIQQANATAGHDTITFDAPGVYVLTIPGPNEDAAVSGDLDITEGLAIVGIGDNDVIISMTTADRVFHVLGATDVHFQNLTIMNGNFAAGNGGGILNAGGELFLEAVTLANNIAAHGGGIVNEAGEMTLTSSTVSGNTANNQGGGIFNTGLGIVQVVDSTLDNNEAAGDSGGGIFNEDGTVSLTGSTLSRNRAFNGSGAGILNGGDTTLTNSTLSQNEAGGDGGGVFNVRSPTGQVTLVHSTVAQNVAAAGGGIYTEQGVVTLVNSIVADNSIGGDCLSAPSAPGTFVDAGRNLDSDASCGLSAATGSIANGIADLGPLQNYGGPTETHFLLDASQALDAADGDTCLPTDQRGISRPQNAACDIGAFERGETESPDEAGEDESGTDVVDLSEFGPESEAAGEDREADEAADPASQPAEFGPESMAPGPAAEEGTDPPGRLDAPHTLFLPLLQADGSPTPKVAAVMAAQAGGASAGAGQRVQGDFNGDGYDDLAIGVPFESIGTMTMAGAVNVIYGSGAGLTDAGNQLWHQDMAGIHGTAYYRNFFGWSLAAGDFNGDGYDDLAIGTPGQTVGVSPYGDLYEAGAVQVLYGSSAGLSADDTDIWHEALWSFIDEVYKEYQEQFGDALAAGDFNGDGYDALAIGQPGAKDGVWQAGAVYMLYGSGYGLTPAGDQVWHQDSPGILGVAEEYEYFGRVLAAGDFDGDGYDDLAIGVPWENFDISNKERVGVVHIIYGSPGGLSANDNQVWHQASPGIKGVAEEDDRFSSALAAGDFDGDGYDDLAIGVPGESVGTLSYAGAVNVLFGTGGGLSAAGNVLWHQDSAGIRGYAQAGDVFGRSLAFGDFDGDGYDDLAVGVPGEDLRACKFCWQSIEAAGVVNVIYGWGDWRVEDIRDEVWTQASPGIQGMAEEDDYFGGALAVGNFNGGPDDLAIAVPLEDVGTVAEAGAVNVIYGARVGLSAAGNQIWHQDSLGIEGVAEPEDRFGVAAPW